MTVMWYGISEGFRWRLIMRSCWLQWVATLYQGCVDHRPQDHIPGIEQVQAIIISASIYNITDPLAWNHENEFRWLVSQTSDKNNTAQKQCWVDRPLCVQRLKHARYIKVCVVQLMCCGMTEDVRYHMTLWHCYLLTAFSISMITRVDRAILGGWGSSKMLQSSPRKRSSCTRHWDWWVYVQRKRE